MNKIVVKEDIKSKIYEIRGLQVMTDFDLANLFEIETKRINEAVKNNPKKFPSNYSWKLNAEESKKFLVENFDQKNIEKRGGRYKSPRVFTEYGIVMLSTILKSDIAIEMSIKITDTFVKMRHFIMENQDIYKSLNNINNKIDDNTNRINYLFSKFERKEELLLKDKPFTAYKTIFNILNTSKDEIIIIDNYADISILDLIKNIKLNVILITKDSNRLSNSEVDKYNHEYHNLNVIRDNSFHDRYVIIDRCDIYHLGCSINSIGKRISMISKISDNEVKETILNIISEIIK